MKPKHFFQIIFLIYFFIGIICVLHAQEQRDEIIVSRSTSLIEDFQSIFEDLDRTKISSGILIDKIISLFKIEKFDGIDSIGEATLNDWNQMYIAMQQGYVKDSIFPDFVTMLLTARSKYISRFKIPISILNAKYNEIKSNAIDDGLLLIQGERLLDISGDTTTPYEERRAFTSASLDDTLFTGETTFLLDASFYFSNDPSQVQSIEINFEDGFGTRTLSFGTETKVIYSTSGEKTIQLSLVFTNGSKLKSKFKIFVRNVSCNYPPIPDETWYITSTIPYYPAADGPFATATVYVLFAPGQTKLTKPFLLLDGFDPAQKRDYDDLASLLCQSNTLELLRQQCYDIILVNWDAGAGYIQKNAFALVELIQKINEEKIRYNELTIAGPSMGGIIERYALSYMEKNNIPHDVRIMITYDSPHKGANIPLGLQEMINFFAPYDPTGIVQTKLSGLNSFAAKQLLVYHYSIFPWSDNPHPLRRQLLQELSDLGDYPKKPLIVGVANGSGTSVAQQNQINPSICSSIGTLMNPGDLMIGYIFYNVVDHKIGKTYTTARGDIWALPNQSPSTKIFSGSYKIEYKIGSTVIITFVDDSKSRSVSGTQPYDNSPGGFTLETNDLKNVPGNIAILFPYFNHVPSVSALDIDPNQITGLFHDIDSDANIKQKTPFKESIIWTVGNNEIHSSICEDKRDFLLNIIGNGVPQNLYLQNEIVATDKFAEANNTITAGTDVNPDPTVLDGPYTIIPDGFNVVFQAGNEIILQDGFIAEQGSNFHAYIAPIGFCDVPQLRVAPAYDFDDTMESYSPPSLEETKKTNDFNTEVSSSYPNPFYTGTIIQYSLKESSPVHLSVYNVFGQQVATLVSHPNQEAGVYQVTFNAGNLPSGIYFYTLRVGSHSYGAGNFMETKKMVLMK